MTWQPIESHRGLYEVSSSGQVRKTSGVPVKQWLNDQGYSIVRLSSPRAQARVHRLVAAAFLPNPSNLPVVNHIDCDRSNNNASNLEWCTQKHNLQHARDLGRMYIHPKGAPSPSASLSEGVVREIRRVRKKTGLSHEKLAALFGTNKKSVTNILSGKTYRWVTPPAADDAGKE